MHILELLEHVYGALEVGITLVTGHSLNQKRH